MERDLCLYPSTEVSRKISLASWLGLNSHPLGLQIYVAVWLVLLTVLLFTLHPNGWVSELAIGILGAYRLQDQLFASLDDAIGITGRSREYARIRLFRIVLNLMNLGTLIVIFAAAYRQLGAADHNAFAAPPPHGAFSYLYMSWTNLLTLGSRYYPHSDAALALVMAEVSVGLLQIGVTLGSIVSSTTEMASNMPSESALPSELSVLLLSLAKLKDEGILTDQEFATAKQRLLRDS